MSEDNHGRRKHMPKQSPCCRSWVPRPMFVGEKTPSSMTPAVRNRSTNRRMFPSAISAATVRTMIECGMLQPSSGPPGGHALADIAPLKIAKFEERVLYWYTDPHR